MSSGTATQEEYPLTTPTHISSSETSAFTVDYQWSKGKVRIHDASRPEDGPLYIAEYGLDNHIFRRASDNQIIGTGHNSLISIDSEYTVNGHSSEIKAARRLKTEYTHLSYALADSPDAPRPMEWKANANLKYWDFTCVDAATKEPVARFHSNIWYVRKIGTIEFLGTKAQTPEAQRELMVVGLTMYNQMIIRMNNPLSLLGTLKKPKPYEAGSSSDAGLETDDTKSVERIQIEAGKTKVV